MEQYFTIGIPFPMTTSRTGYLVLAFWNRGIANSYSKWRVFGQYGDRKKPQGLDPRSEVFCGLRCLRYSSLLQGGRKCQISRFIITNIYYLLNHIRGLLEELRKHLIILKKIKPYEFKSVQQLKHTENSQKSENHNQVIWNSSNTAHFVTGRSQIYL